MTISTFANSDNRPALPGRTVRQQYRALKRLEAEERQAAFDTEVAKTAHEQNCEPGTARNVVRGRRRFEQRLIARMLVNPLVNEVRL